METVGDRAEAEGYVRLAMAQAEEAARAGNRPFGAVIVDSGGKVAIADHNRVVEQMDPTAHAEITAIRTLCRRRRVEELARGYEHHQVRLHGGILGDEAAEQLTRLSE